jgi:hypothetical protein
MLSAIDMLLSGATRCSVCGVYVTHDDDRLEIRGSFNANICSPCQQDYFLHHRETMEQTLERGCHPTEVVPKWRRH